jgi:serine/threonine-protein kinase
VTSLINEHFHNWVIRELIGAGGVAEVFRAEHADDPRSLAALKAMRPERAADKQHACDLEREHAMLTGLDHPGIPKPKRLGEIRGRPALLMDFVPGRTVAQLDAAKVGYDRARALVGLVGIVAYLHQRGIVHNDLKLENVILGEGGAVSLVDFGSARPAGGTSFFRRFFRKPTTVFGTVAYVAPELIAGHRPTVASDAYSLGICAFRLLGGAMPFDASSRSSRLRAHAQDAPPSIRERVAQLPPAMAKAIDACLDKRPMARPDLPALAAALEGIEALLPPDAPHSRRFTMRTSKRMKPSSRRMT